MYKSLDEVRLTTEGNKTEESNCIEGVAGFFFSRLPCARTLEEISELYQNDQEEFA